MFFILGLCKNKSRHQADDGPFRNVDLGHEAFASFGIFLWLPDLHETLVENISFKQEQQQTG